MSQEVIEPTFEPTFEAFWIYVKTKIIESPPNGTKQKFYDAVKQVGFVSSNNINLSAKPTPKGGRRTGYNVFQNIRNLQLKAEGMEGSDRSAKILQEWKAMSPTDKANWNKQGTGGTTTTKTLSGYNLYVTEENKRLKALHPTEKVNYLPQIAKQWKELSQSIKDDWKQRAKNQNAGVTVTHIPVLAPVQPGKIGGVKITIPATAVDEFEEEEEEEVEDS